MPGFPNTNDYAKALQDLVDVNDRPQILDDPTEIMKEPEDSSKGVAETHRINVWWGVEDAAKRQAAFVEVFGNQ